MFFHGLIVDFYHQIMFHGLDAHGLLIHSPSEGQLSCFQVWAIVNKAALSLLAIGFDFSGPHL